MRTIWRLRARARARLAQRRRRGERGAVAVEAALVTPLLFLLLFGIIEFGFVFKNYLAVVSSSRAGARIASAMPRDANFAQTAANAVVREGSALEQSQIEEVWVYKADKSGGQPVGRPTGDFSDCSVCVKFRVDAAGGGMVAVKTSDTWASTSQNACSGDVNLDYIGVYVEYSNPGITGLIFDRIDLADHAVMSLEPIPLTRGCKP